MTVGLLVTYLFQLYLNQPQKSLIAIDAKTGKVAWSVSVSDAHDDRWNPRLVYTTDQSNRVFVGAATGNIGDTHTSYQIQGFDVSSGQNLWTFTPTLENNRNLLMYAQGNTLWLSLLNEKKYVEKIGKSGQKLARLANMRQGEVIAIDAATGKQRWEIEIGALAVTFQNQSVSLLLEIEVSSFKLLQLNSFGWKLTKLLLAKGCGKQKSCYRNN